MGTTQNGSLWSMRPDAEMKFAPNELEFLAAEEQIEIVPKFSFSAVELLSGTIGPFEVRMGLAACLWGFADIVSIE